MDQQIKLLVSSLAAPFRIFLLALFLLLAKAGWFTWLTPESAASIVNAIMDFLIVAVPALYMVWAGIRSYRDKIAEAKAKEPVEIVKAAAALPQVKEIVTTAAMAAAVPDPTVTAG